MKVLIVDDDPEIREVLKVFLESNGLLVSVAENAETALKRLVLEEPDLVMLDIVLPDKSGLEVLKEIRELDRRVSVAMITGYKEAEKVVEAFRLGAIDCLLKPFNFEYIKNNLLPRITPRNPV